MNEVLQRIAIAESQGWKHVICSVGEHGTMMSGWWMPCGALTTDINMLPDYLNDLNAMHEAEEILTTGQRGEFWDVLHRMVARHKFWGDDTTNDTCFRVMHVTAAQRAEAFLKTLNLWIP